MSNKNSWFKLYLIFSITLLTACGGSHTPQEDFAWPIPPSISTPVPTFTPMPTSPPQDPEVDEALSEDFVVIYESNRALDGSETKAPGTANWSYSNMNIWSYSNKTKKHIPLTKLAGDQKSATQPEPSPDGTKILFIQVYSPPSSQVTSSSVWVMDKDGSNPKQLTASDTYSVDSAQWSPDGKRIVYVSDQHLDMNTTYFNIENIFIMNQDGSNQKALTTDTSFPCHNTDVSFSPNGQKIVYSSNCGPYVPSGAFGQYQASIERIYTIDLSTGKAEKAKGLLPTWASADGLEPYNRDQLDPEFSPDGKSILFSSRVGVSRGYVSEQDTKGSLFLLSSDNYFCWEVDAVTGAVIEHLSGSSYTHPLLANYSKIVNLIPLVNFSPWTDCRYAHRTPDGKKIFVISTHMVTEEEKKQGLRTLWLMEPYGDSLEMIIKAPQEVVGARDWSPSRWSGDGNKLVYMVAENIWVTGITKKKSAGCPGGSTCYCSEDGCYTEEEMDKVNFSLTSHPKGSGIQSRNPRFLSNKIPNYFLPSFDIKKPNKKGTNWPIPQVKLY